MYMPKVPKDYPVQPKLGVECEKPVQCGTCWRVWDDAIVTSMTPAPSARCPFEAFHPIHCGECDSDDVSVGKREGDALAPDTSYYECGDCGHIWGEE